ACVGSDYDGNSGFQTDSDVTRPVGSAADCIGGYPGIFDLCGNVDEWEDSCSENGDNLGAYDLCRVRGGSFAATGLWCRMAFEAGREGFWDYVGFRCCAD